jgi:ribose/xylose/arabinose/galactoside ABC-type transport system permease subunit
MSDKGMNRGSLRRIAENNIFILLLVAVILFTVFSLLSSTFFSKYNLKTFLINLSFFVIVATGETLVLISGNLDFSIGGVIALTSVLVAKLYELGTNIYVAIVLALLVGVLTGILNGWLVVKMKLNSIIVTLGTSAITSGLAFVISNALTIAIFEDTLGFLGRGYIVRIPVPIILMAAVVIFASIQFFLYIICGLGASLGGLVLTSLSAVGMPRHGVGQEIAIITAVILGGVPLGGGKGSVVGTLIGMFIMQLIYNGLTQLNVIPYYIQIIQGLLLITIVTIYVRSESISRGVKE